MKRSAYAVAVLAGVAAGSGALAQTAPLQSHDVAWKADSGLARAKGNAETGEVVYETTVFVPHASWLRLSFEAVELSGRVEEGNGAFLRITSLTDGAVQYLNAESARQWSNTSAYFNGDVVHVELVAFGGQRPSRVAIASVTAGDPEPAGPDTICGPTDDRVLSSDPRSARHLTSGCTSWLFNDVNRMFITAGHCGVSSAGSVEEFNVPLSTSTGAIQHPPPEDQYPAETASIQFIDGGPGADYTYFACFPNSNTGLTAFQRAGQYYTLAAAAPAVASGQTIRVTGYGVTVSGQAPLTWSQVQKTHSGPYFSLVGTQAHYQVDTTGGNSGSAVENMSDGGRVIAIHTHAGLQTALGSPRGLCKSGIGAVTPPLYAISDGANNFGTLDRATGNFAKITETPPRMEGLTYNWNAGVFYAVSNDTYGVAPGAAGRKLWTIDPATGAAAYVGNISGASGIINGLGYDPHNDVLYGVVQATGQLVTINTTSAVATAIGAPNGGTIGGLEFDPNSSVLFGIDDSGGASKLVKWADPTQPMTVVGSLGAGIADCNGLAVTDDGMLWTVNAGTKALLRVSPASGAATVIGTTGGEFGASYGMAAVLTPQTTACYANCDHSTTPPVLNVNDFICFQAAFAAGDPYANCDGSTTPPVLNVNDFICFQAAFAAGCSAP
jgi:hypothetical protein